MSTDTYSGSDPAVRTPEPQTRIVLSDVSLRFRRYGGGPPSLKQTILSMLGRRPRARPQDFLLYDHLSLTANRGDCLGVIGANGAGKSTLLKVICGIYPSTTGRVEVVGRVAPLIELGGGLHPELSGRENIFLAGALLGFGPKEMQHKIDGILQFAGMGQFAETPLKYYSSGMMLRLAFSIATDVEAEILLIDEIFATGDQEFVRKGTERMIRLMDDAHIVVLVSHDMDLIRRVTNRVIWMDHGQIVRDGQPDEVCAEYLEFEARK